MKAVEFKARMKNKLIRVPDNLSSELSEDKDVRVIVLLEEIKDQEENDFMILSKEQFLAGYSDSDSIYDNGKTNFRGNCLVEVPIHRRREL